MRMILLGILILFLVFFAYFFIGSKEPAQDIVWGVSFSQKHAQSLGLNWQETYLALLDDLGVKNIKIISHWDLIEPREGEYDFQNLDWQIQEAEERGTKILLVIGMRTPRWPECHIPGWAKDLSKENQQKEILKLLEQTILRYRDRLPVWAWQVENEPLLPFGECPKGVLDKAFLKKEINLVKSLDSDKPVIMADTGEFSFWITAARLGDMVGTTLHRKVWFKEIKTYVAYPFRPIFYWRKAQIIKKVFNKEVIVGELQAEPWCPNLLYNCSLAEQAKTMNLEQFVKNVKFARQTGLSQFYLWGAEWWYWMKEKQDDPRIWNEARKLFISSEL